MTIKISVQAEDLYGNPIYFILQNGRWSAIDKFCLPHALSNFSGNGAELYIALANCESKSDAIRAINKHANYLKKNSAK
jgi:hypothetical protein